MNNKGISTVNKYIKILTVKNYSKNTIEIYSHYVKIFIKEFKNNIYHLNDNNIQDFFYNYKFTSVSQQNQFISSVKLLFKYIVGKTLKGVNLERPRKERKLPRVIDNDYIIDKLYKINNLKHKAILSLTYSISLRVSEVINLKIKDIDSKRMIIHIINSKGHKDRVLPLSENILKLLRLYFLQYKPSNYLFNGQNKDTYSATSCNKIIKKYLGNNYHMHILRHSCFTYLLEKGTNLRIIQKIAGHSSIKTTEIYTHVSNKILNNVKLPI